MDKLDKFNDTILELSTNWKYIFYFVAGIYILATILYFGAGSKWALMIISWAIIVFAAIIFNIVLKEKKTSDKNIET